LRLNPGLRLWTYAAFAALLASGTAWLIADQLKDSESGETAQWIAAEALMIHGILAMIVLVLLGAMIPLHVQRSWRAGKNRLSGGLMVAINVILVGTAAGLYYAGSEWLRTIAADIHIGIGIALPVIVVAHVILGRRERSFRIPARTQAASLDIAGAMRPASLSQESQYR